MKTLYTLEKRNDENFTVLQLVSMEDGKLILSAANNGNAAHVPIDLGDLENMFLNATIETRVPSNQRIIREL